MGNANSGKRKDKQFHTALSMEIAEAEPGRDLRAIAKKVISKALDPKDKDFMAAANFIADRLDGKPAQAIVGGDDDDNPISLLHRIENIIVDPGTPNPDSAGVQAPSEPSKV